ncbi:30S ribosomal protein S9 [bacterium]|jgi:small subunit ribosomal protein S9|nr:30S ribosomal protein S9 [bacterium]
MAETKTKATTKKKAAPKTAVAKPAVAAVTKPTSVKAPVTKAKRAAKRPRIPKEAFYATGRRKCSIAKVWLYPGKGQVLVNNQTVEDYIRRPVLVNQIVKPLKTLNFEGKYDIQIKTLGGGLSGQAGAAQLGIARAILAMNEEYRKSLKGAGLLTRDSRIKERKKYGKRGARKGPTYRKR